MFQLLELIDFIYFYRFFICSLLAKNVTFLSRALSLSGYNNISLSHYYYFYNCFRLLFLILNTFLINKWYKNYSNVSSIFYFTIINNKQDQKQARENHKIKNKKNKMMMTTMKCWTDVELKTMMKWWGRWWWWGRWSDEDDDDDDDAEVMRTMMKTMRERERERERGWWSDGDDDEDDAAAAGD